MMLHHQRTQVGGGLAGPRSGQGTGPPSAEYAATKPALPQALCVLGSQWMRTVWRCGTEGVTYDPAWPPISSTNHTRPPAAAPSGHDMHRTKARPPTMLTIEGRRHPHAANLIRVGTARALLHSAYN